MNEFEVLFTNGKIIDGTGAPWYRGDVGLNGGRISAVGKLSGKCTAQQTFDISGLVLSPGFIDIHCHSDFAFLEKGLCDSKICQGVTTQVIGHCGISAAPVSPQYLHLLDSYTGNTKAGVDVPWSWTTFDQWLDFLADRDLPTNVMSCVGQGTLRIAVMGFEKRKASEEELGKMRALLEESLDAGAVGLSSGLIYPPGLYTDENELADLCSILSRYNAPYFSHIRNESSQLVEALEEAIRLGERCLMPVHISHHKAAGRKNWGTVSKTLKIMEEARSRGIDVTADQYPYVAGCSTLRAILPPWVHEGGVPIILERLKQPETRIRIVEEIKTGLDWENMYLNCSPEGILLIYTPFTPEMQELSLAEAASKMNLDPIDAVIELIIRNEGCDGAVYSMMCEDDVEKVMKHPLVMIGSDSIPAGPGMSCHPRTNGTFPRVLGRYAREKQIMSIEEAVRKMTSLPAMRLGLQKKGVIREGMDGDIVIFNEDLIQDRADYKKPFEQPVGISHVVINGVFALKNGNLTGLRPGQVLRKSKQCAPR